MDWYYFWYVNKKKVWILGLLLLILLFVVSIILSKDENRIGIAGQLTTTTREAAPEPTIASRTTITSRLTTTTDLRVPFASRRMETEIYCIVAEDCSGKEHPLCNGFWTCEKNLCMWYCWS